MKEFSEEIKSALTVLRSKGVILYPTDTIWGIGCDATIPEAVQKIFAIKKRREENAFILLLDHESRLLSYVKDVPEQAWMLIEHTEKPLTIIFDQAKNLPPEVIARDGSVAIRITRDPFCQGLISALRKPLVSTSANISGEPYPSSFSDINPEIISGVDYVVNHRQNENSILKPSTILRLKTNGQIQFIRR